VKPPKTPQEKKALSYKKDRHTFAWHSDKGLRKARPKRKANANQQYRRKADVEVQGLLKTAEPGNEDACVTNDLLSSGLTKKRLRKIVSCSLREAIAYKQEGRIATEGRRVRRRQSQMEETRTAVAFLLRINKKEALALIDAIVLQRIAYGEFLKLRERNPELVNTAMWFWQYPWRWTARNLLRSDRERLNKLDECIKEIDRIVQVRVRANQRVAPRGFAATCRNLLATIQTLASCLAS
jgi:hypothetical protein